MREIHTSQITETVAHLCIKANTCLNEDIANAFRTAADKETESLPRDILNILIENAEIAKCERIPFCQDTGMTVVYLEIGQDVHISGGSVYDAVNMGVVKGYDEGYLRKSVVKDPINRTNTNDNTPAIVYIDMAEGENIKITVAPKGFGSENMSALKMLVPSSGIDGVKVFVIDTVKKAGPNPCPPVIVGVGVGGTMDYAAVLAKKALLRPLIIKNIDPYWANVEEELFSEINRLNIGPGGFGGVTTCLGVNINPYPTHIAGLPVAVNIGCHATRHAEAVI
ncbi:MAG: fumarate hydratase [Clostridiales bacterium]|jgi:fumarate hydratase subunit alpha|nr:fumarate hydratase [Clostridiales bacterium]